MNIRTEEKEASVVQLSGMMQLILDSFKSNAGKKPNGREYKVVMKDLGHLFLNISNLQTYEIMSKNLGFPSVSTVRRITYKHSVVIEGEFRVKELKKFLVERNYPLTVHLSEDATVVKSCAQYHSERNQIVGFPLPLDSEGMPVVGSFPATSAKIMSEYFSTCKPSKNVYCIMAQPLEENAPAFLLAMFGIDNKFTATEVVKRWKKTEEMLSKEGITINGYSSDGDRKLLKSMVYRSIANNTPPKWPWFQAAKNQKIVCVQDTIHIGTKLKSRLLKPSIILPMGPNLVASRGHLLELINTETKDLHLLCLSDICPKDKMNFKAMQRISSPKVTSLLRAKILASEGTALYLDMMKDVVDTYMCPELTPLERVETIWKWIFFLRLLRDWIQKTEGYNLENNFLTSNCYTCIEVNGHALIQLIINYRENEQPSKFLPWLMSSQQCESIFRSARSNSGGVSTFTILEMQNFVRRADSLAATYLTLQGIVDFPRHHKAFKKSEGKPHIPVSLPEDYEIENAILSAQKFAVALAVKLKILKKPMIKLIPPPSLTIITASHLNLNEEEDNEDSQIDAGLVEDPDEEQEVEGDAELDKENEIADVLEDLYIVSSGSLGLKSFEPEDISETSHFVAVDNGKSEAEWVRKSTFCWFLRKNDTKISSDRLQRVQESESDQISALYSSQCCSSPSVEDYVSIGDWCAFKTDRPGTIEIGRIISFSYLTGATRKQMQYSSTEAPTTPPTKNARGLGVLCTWFSVNTDSSLSPVNMDVNGYYNMDKYVCSVPRPKILKKKLKLSCTLRDIKKLFK